MSFLNCLEDCRVLSVLCLIDRINIIYSLNRLICRYLDNIEVIDLSELGFLCISCTCHS